MEKAFGKQIKTIEDQGEKENQVQVKTIKKYTCDKEDTPLISKQKQIFNELVDKRLDKITEKVNSDNLIYRYKGRTADAKFNEFDNALDLIDKTKEWKISLTDIKINQAKFKSNLGEVKKAHKNRSKELKKPLYDVEMLYKARNEAMKLYDYYSSIISDNKNQAIKETKQRGTGLKILTPKQML